MAILRHIFILSALFILNGCNKDNGSGCFTRVGDIVVEERTVEAPFTAIGIYDDAIVSVEQGSEYKIEVRGGSNLLPSYITRFEDNKLILENKTVCQWLRDQNTPFEVFITMPVIDSILFYGYGDIKSKGLLSVDQFKFETRDGVGDVDLELEGTKLELIMHTGATNMKIKGSIEYVYAYSTSYSILDMKELAVDSAFYVNGGTGDFTVNTKNYIKSKLDLTGDIYYNQSPFIFIESQLGSGQMIHY